MAKSNKTRFCYVLYPDKTVMGFRPIRARAGSSLYKGKYATRKIHTKPHPGLEWRILYILTSEDAEFTDIMFDP